MMRKIFLLLIAASVPAVMFVTVKQVYRYNQIDREVNSLILNQRELFEQNKRMVANISILSSPGRIDSLAANELELQKESGEKIRIEIEGAGENAGD